MLAIVPAQATSLMRTAPGVIAVGVLVGEFVGDEVNVRVREGVKVLVGDGVGLAVCVAVGKDVWEGVFDGVGEKVDVCESVSVSADVWLSVGEAVRVCVGEADCDVEFSDLGVPFMGSPLASSPLRRVPLLVPQFDGKSSLLGSTRSIEA